MLGNSITNGCEWAELLGNSNVVNRGISGDTVEGIQARLGSIIKAAPAKIFLMIGVNDVSHDLTADSIATSIGELVHRIRTQSPATKLYLQSLLPVNQSFGNPRHQCHATRHSRARGSHVHQPLSTDERCRRKSAYRPHQRRTAPARACLPRMARCHNALHQRITTYTIRLHRSGCISASAPVQAYQNFYRSSYKSFLYGLDYDQAYNIGRP